MAAQRHGTACVVAQQGVAQSSVVGQQAWWDVGVVGQQVWCHRPVIPALKGSTGFRVLSLELYSESEAAR